MSPSAEQSSTANGQLVDSPLPHHYNLSSQPDPASQALTPPPPAQPRAYASGGLYIRPVAASPGPFSAHPDNVHSPSSLRTSQLSFHSSIQSMSSGEAALWTESAPSVRVRQEDQEEAPPVPQIRMAPPRALTAIPGISLAHHFLPSEMRQYLALHCWTPESAIIVAGILVKAKTLADFFNALIDAGMYKGEASYFTDISKDFIGKF